jgi:hypothetical protein
MILIGAMLLVAVTLVAIVIRRGRRARG